MKIRLDRFTITKPQKADLTKLIICILFFSLNLSAQNTIRGRILDADRVPIDYATVYVNGTTTGAVTDEGGTFEFAASNFPCELVISHLNYKTFSYRLVSKPEQGLNIILEPQNYEIDSIVVVVKGNRAENMRIFKDNFLGRSPFNNKATILNEDQIVFERKYETDSLLVDKTVPAWREKYATFKNDITWSQDSSEIYYQTATRLFARCKSPLQVLVPSLGYSILYDLQQFTCGFRKNGIGVEQCFYFGYSFFKETKDSKRVRRLRNKAYYNSSQHFCRSLYHNTLASNGYQLLCNNDSGSLIPADLSTHISYEGNVARITGSEYNDFYILYHTKMNGDILDLTKSKPSQDPTQSQLFLNSDTCLFTNKGIIPNNDMAFSQAIANKKIGSMLPIDFEPYGNDDSNPIFLLAP